MKIKKSFCFLFTLLLAAPVMGMAAMLSNSAVELRTEMENWQSGLGGSTSALLVGAGVSHQFNKKYSVTGGFISGNHNMNSDSNVSINRKDFDIGGIYHFQQPYFAFAGYRLIQLDYAHKLDNSRSFTDNMHGFGVGAGSFLTVRKNIYLYARASFSLLLSTLKYNAAPTDRGGGTSFGTEGGVIYQFKERANAALSVKYQSNNIDYKNDLENWVSSYFRLGLSLSHSFK